MTFKSWASLSGFLLPNHKDPTDTFIKLKKCAYIYQLYTYRNLVYKYIQAHIKGYVEIKLEYLIL